MKSDIYEINSNTDMEELLDEVERIGSFCKLKAAETLRLRLLVEEMLQMTDRLLRRTACDFWIENEDKAFELHMNLRAFVDGEQKEKLISVSSTQQNQATKGIMGKITSVFENLLLGETDLPYELDYEAYRVGALGSGQYSAVWSMVEYQASMSEDEKKADWDGLEKSILANLADDVTIGVRPNKVEMVVRIGF